MAFQFIRAITRRLQPRVLPFPRRPMDSPAELVLPQASAIEKLPPRPAPTSAYVWDEWSPRARMVYLRDSDEANTYLARLQPGCIGFDLEWKPTYVKGAKENPVALVQLANDSIIYLIQVSAMKEFPSKLRQILEDPAFVKAGVGIQGDTKKLYTDWGVSVRSCVDLSLLARSVDDARWKGKYNSSIGLARLVEVYCYRLLTKGKITRSNWESDLKAAQQLYASNDAHAGFTVYNHLVAMINPSSPPETKYYTFNCIRGYYCEPMGLPWAPINPNYDPGPPPPLKPRRELSKQDQPSEPRPAPEDPNISLQRFESVLKIAHSTWLRKQDAETQDGQSFHSWRYNSNAYVIPQPLQSASHQGQYHPSNFSANSNINRGTTLRGVNRQRVRHTSPSTTILNTSVQGQQQQQPKPTPTPPSTDELHDRPQRPRYRSRRPKPSPQPAVV